VKGYPRWFTRAVVVTIVAAVATGLLLAPTMLFMRLDWEVPWRLADSSRIAVAAAHVAVAFATLAFLGALWSVHMRSNWRHHLNRGSGLTMAIALLGLLATGIGIFYLGDELLSLSASIAHALLGIATAGVFAYHAIAARKAVRKLSQRHAAAPAPIDRANTSMSHGTPRAPAHRGRARVHGARR
jgi:heme A synthase